MTRTSLALLLATCASAAAPVFAFDSGSTGADGSLSPNVDTEVPLPPDGVLHYSDISIPSGVTVRFQRNALNTPVTLLVAGDAMIAGSLVLSGSPGADSNGAGSGNVGDDGLPGGGGPGGFAGGQGGEANASSASGGPRQAQAGIGPGGGRPTTRLDVPYCRPSGGSFGSGGDYYSSSSCGGVSAPTYGNPDLLPLVGGSGGSGGSGWNNLGGGGGGGGGGALLLAVSGTLTVSGSILANGGHGADVGNDSQNGGAPGGGGSGGAIRLIATTLTGNGTINAVGARGGDWINQNAEGDGGAGRIRLEAENFLRTANTNPAFTLSEPGPLVIAGMPSIRIASVAGINAPAEPTGVGDIVLPLDTPDPVPLLLETSNVPLGNTISIIVTPPRGRPETVVSTAIQGSEASGTATATVSLADGSSVLLATLSYSVSETQGLALSQFTGGEPVARVELAAGLAGPSTTLVTASGRRVDVPAAAL